MRSLEWSSRWLWVAVWVLGSKARLWESGQCSSILSICSLLSARSDASLSLLCVEDGLSRPPHRHSHVSFPRGEGSSSQNCWILRRSPCCELTLVKKSLPLEPFSPSSPLQSNLSRAGKNWWPQAPEEKGCSGKPLHHACLVSLLLLSYSVIRALWRLGKAALGFPGLFCLPSLGWSDRSAL